MQEEEYDSDTSDDDYVADKEDIHPSSSELDSDYEGTEGVQETRYKNRSGKTESPDNNTANVETVEDVKKVKEKEDKLWADFLDDVEETPKPTTAKVNSTKIDTFSKQNAVNINKPLITKNVNKNDTSETTIKITKVFEFAGEEVRVEEEVAADSKEAKINTNLLPKMPTSTGSKRGGASGLLDLLQNKKAKLSTLQKTQLDWNSFKKTEGLDDELELHKKSKSGYLEKQDFLARTDLKQFEIEKELRRKNRSKR